MMARYVVGKVSCAANFIGGYELMKISFLRLLELIQNKITTNLVDFSKIKKRNFVKRGYENALSSNKKRDEQDESKP